jgi:hypothetical protein
MDAKERWPLVKFLVAATGLSRQDARTMIDEMDEAKMSKVWLDAQLWDHDSDKRAVEMLSVILGADGLATLIRATKAARHPQLKQPQTQFEDGPRRKRAGVARKT